MIVADGLCELATILAQAYRECLPQARFISFEDSSPEEILAAFDALRPSDLVVLIQSTNFRLDAFRLRVELFNRAIKVIEHPRLAMMTGLEVSVYLDSLEYDAAYYRSVGPALKARLDSAGRAEIHCGDQRLVFEGGLESAKLNIGDYSGMKNTGGMFPIGEVFTEARDLTKVNGSVLIFAFGDTAFKVNKPDKPMVLRIENGRVTETRDSTPEFEKVLAGIRAEEGEVWVRELGLGLNRAFTRQRMVTDIGTYERMCGVHLSLGAKHTIYKKPQFSRKTARHHVDIFAAADSVLLDEKEVYREGCWRLQSTITINAAQKNETTAGNRTVVQE